MMEAKGLGVPTKGLHGFATSSRSTPPGGTNIGHLYAIQEATLSPHRILNIVDDVVESGTLEGLVQHLIERFGEQLC